MGPVVKGRQAGLGWLFLGAMFASTVECLAAPPSPLADSKQTVTVPAWDENLQRLEARAEAQKNAVPPDAVDHDFRFVDRQAQSGITFRQHGVDDSGKHYKAVHYDHGNGVLVADVNGDDHLDLYFLSQIGRNELWINHGDGTFRDATATAGVALDDRISVSGSFADYDNDGDADLYVTTVRRGNALFQNDGHGHFRDVTAAAGLAYSGHSSGSVFFDFDNDGLLDLFLTNVGNYTTSQVGAGGYFVGREDAFAGHLHPDRTERSILYRNLGNGRFADVSESVGLVDSGWTGDAAFADLNGDGFQDLYVLNMQGDDHYYENRGGKAFVERTPEVFPKTPWGAMGIKFFDFDNDGDLDLILTDMHSDMSHEIGSTLEKSKSVMTWTDETLQGGDNNIFGNAFYRNLGDGRFEEISDEIGVECYWPWGLSTGDLNADGWDDLYITASMNFPFRYGVSSLLLNNRGNLFFDSEFLLGVEPRTESAIQEQFVLDCSGVDREIHLCNGREGSLTVLGSVGSRSSAIFDLDGDGDLDIVTNELNGPPRVLVSDLAQRRAVRSLTVDLEGRASNRDGLGARVRVKAGGDVQTKVLDGKSGYLSQSSTPLYFGLGSAESVESVEVTWPSGKVQTLTQDLAGKTVLLVVEP